MKKSVFKDTIKTMSKIVSFNLELRFADDIVSDIDIIIIANNVARAVVETANKGEGIAPQNGDTYLEEVIVKQMYLETTVSLKTH